MRVISAAFVEDEEFFSHNLDFLLKRPTKAVLSKPADKAIFVGDNQSGAKSDKGGVGIRRSRP